jgi:hypothetical protein
MGETYTASRIFMGTFLGIHPLERLKRMLEDNTKVNIIRRQKDDIKVAVQMIGCEERRWISSNCVLCSMTFFYISGVELSALGFATAVLVNSFLLHANKLKEWRRILFILVHTKDRA